MPFLSIIVPIYNEEKYLNSFLAELLDKLDKQDWSYELILSENGSSDKTILMARQLAKKNKKVKFVSLPEPNYGLAVKTGFLKAKGRFLILFDLDYYQIGFIKKAVKMMPDYDVVAASKLDKRSDDLRPWIRRLATSSFSFLLKSFFGLKISDTHGIKMLNRKRFLPLINRCLFTNEIFDTELLIRAQQEGLRLTEVNVRVREKRPSRSSIFKRAVKTMIDLFRLKIILMREKLDNKRLWRIIWRVTGVLFVLMFGWQGLKLSRSAAIIGEVHHQRQRQAEVKNRLFSGQIGRLVSNRYLIAADKVKEKSLEIIDPNIYFFAGHPNERADVKENERVAWWLIPFFILGISALKQRSANWKNGALLWLALGSLAAMGFETVNNRALFMNIAWVYFVSLLGLIHLTRKARSG